MTAGAGGAEAPHEEQETGGSGVGEVWLRVGGGEGWVLGLGRACVGEGVRCMSYRVMCVVTETGCMPAEDVWQSSTLAAFHKSVGESGILCRPGLQQSSYGSGDRTLQAGSVSNSAFNRHSWLEPRMVGPGWSKRWPAGTFLQGLHRLGAGVCQGQQGPEA